MSSTLREEIRQTRPFASREQEALLSIVRTSALLMDHLEVFLRGYGVTITQYNVLRILRGAEPEGLCRNDLRDRMLTRMPDVTRLLDRMEDAGLVARSRRGSDRRIVTSRITAKGSKLLATLDPLVAEQEKQFFAGIPSQQVDTLVDVLEALRRRLRA